MADYGTPRKVEYYSASTDWELQYSEREYIPIDNIHGSVASPPEAYVATEVKFVNVTLYLDVLTGMVVWDVETYEKNMRETQ